MHNFHNLLSGQGASPGLRTNQTIHGDARCCPYASFSLRPWAVPAYAQSGELVSVMDNCFRPAQEIHVVWPKSRYLALKTRCAIDAQVAEIPAMIGAPEPGTGLTMPPTASRSRT